MLWLNRLMAPYPDCRIGVGQPTMLFPTLSRTVPFVRQLLRVKLVEAETALYERFMKAIGEFSTRHWKWEEELPAPTADREKYSSPKLAIRPGLKIHRSENRGTSRR